MQADAGSVNALGFLIVLLGSVEDYSLQILTEPKLNMCFSRYFLAFSVNCNRVMFLFIFFVVVFQGAGTATKGVWLPLLGFVVLLFI